MTPRAGRPAGDDEGSSLAELLVTMTIMTVVMVLFTGATLQVYRTVQATDTLTTAQAQISIAFQRFDRQLRYATYVTDPKVVATSTGDTWYVEFAGLPGEKCRQLRLELGPSGSTGPGLLQLIEWTPGSPPAATVRGTTIAANVDVKNVARTNSAPVSPEYRPFDRQEAGDKPYAAEAVGSDFRSDFQRLRIHVKTKVAAGQAEIDTTFTALNSNGEPPANDCSEGRP